MESLYFKEKSSYKYVDHLYIRFILLIFFNPALTETGKIEQIISIVTVFNRFKSSEIMGIGIRATPHN